MISKKDFIEVLNNIQYQEDKDQKLSKFLSNNDYVDGHIVGSFSEPLMSTTIKLLSLFFEDGAFNKKNDTWLEWFIYENDCGKKKMLCFMDNIEYKITDAEEMYDFLILWKGKSDDNN